MEDVSALVGHVAVKVGGKDFIIDNAGWDDWSVFKNSFIEEKRTRMIGAVVRLKSKVPSEISQDDYREALREAINEAGTVEDVGERDLREIMSSRDGMAFMLWVMLERRYPQLTTRAQCSEAVKESAVTEDTLLTLTNAMFKSMGLSMESSPADAPSGNDVGQVKVAGAA